MPTHSIERWEAFQGPENEAFGVPVYRNFVTSNSFCTNYNHCSVRHISNRKCITEHTRARTTDGKINIVEFGCLTTKKKIKGYVMII